MWYASLPAVPAAPIWCLVTPEGNVRWRPSSNTLGGLLNLSEK
jgi:hypothetical protein